jgi:hypothetical protein
MAHRISSVLVVASVVVLTLAARGPHPVQKAPLPDEYEAVSITPGGPEVVDIVMVTDDSGAMYGEQAAIADNLDAFAQEFASDKATFMSA